MKRTLLVLLSANLLACSHQAAMPESASQQQTAPIPTIQCGATPPPLNTQGIRNNLLNRGDITPEMTEAQQQAVINEYIAKRNDAYKKCHKGKSL
ncbi:MULTISPECIES: hypothetical protein [Shewanella]|uniref:hypothetical protein n=1 Tax=Shewanella TaxID=22 RepID=UPI0006D6852F|nr:MULTISPECIES: hypothetical protein [Shewanella]OBT04224.1 hypothetical protein A9267_18205 [Shewanella sp. UCD-FRSSP16_17]